MVMTTKTTPKKTPQKAAAQKTVRRKNARNLTQRPRMLIIFNPTAGQRKQHLLTQTVQCILKYKWDVTLKPTHKAGDAIELARWAVEDDKYQIVCAAGGDGTINEVVTGLLHSKGHHVPLGIIPLGTANVLANELGYGKTPKEWAQSLTRNKSHVVHVGEVQQTNSKKEARAFICMAGIGFDAAVVASVSSPLKKKIGKGAYIWRSLQLMVGLNQTEYDVKIDGKDQGKATAVVACNGRFYGGRFVLAPKAKITEGSLYFAVFDGKGLGAIIRLMVGLGMNRAHKLKGMRLIKGTKLEVTNGRGEPIQADGDNAANLPATFTMAKGTVTVIKP
ncbi:MAG: sphingosine kinase [Magnetococcales bacterium]|nr:sphingosine kinase [Magnetococcales bacterium]|tara:strand:- start:127611 stop:128609 length:999 start_codon:yes stop_codon:yes gene_type:complete